MLMHTMRVATLVCFIIGLGGVSASFFVASDGSLHLPEPLFVNGVNVTAQLERNNGASPRSAHMV
jgi:hypothetical protein